MTEMVLTSRDIAAGEPIPLVHALSDVGGENVSPDLRWTSPPPSTGGFAVTMFDLDEPTGVGFVHWTVFNLPSELRELESGAAGGGLSQGAQSGFTDWGECGYGGPAPGAGEGPHRYRFTVYALDLPELSASGETTTYAMLQYLMRGHVLATAKLDATYEVGS